MTLNSISPNYKPMTSLTLVDCNLIFFTAISIALNNITRTSHILIIISLQLFSSCISHLHFPDTISDLCIYLIILFTLMTHLSCSPSFGSSPIFQLLMYLFTLHPNISPLSTQYPLTQTLLPSSSEKGEPVSWVSPSTLAHQVTAGLDASSGRVFQTLSFLLKSL